jgi:hypothetical protein
MLVQFALRFGLLAMSVAIVIFAAVAIELHESPDCTGTTVSQSSPTSPKQRFCAGPPLARDTKKRARGCFNCTSPGKMLSQRGSMAWLALASWKLQPMDGHQNGVLCNSSKVRTWTRCHALRRYYRCRSSERCHCESSLNGPERTRRSRTLRARRWKKAAWRRALSLEVKTSETGKLLKESGGDL